MVRLKKGIVSRCWENLVSLNCYYSYSKCFMVIIWVQWKNSHHCKMLVNTFAKTMISAYMPCNLLDIVPSIFNGIHSCSGKTSTDDKYILYVPLITFKVFSALCSETMIGNLLVM